MAEKAKTNGKSGGASMPLFYTEPMALEAEKHGKLSLNKNFGYAFTKDVNAVPVNMIEMPQVCHVYPIAFSPDAGATPVALLGLRDKENLFLKEDGSWDAPYVPAYIRRYPFIFAETADSDRLTLCVDKNDDVLSEGGDQAFFDKDGNPSDLSKNALEFCKSYHGAATQTAEFSKLLVKHDLLVEREVMINIPGGQKIKFSGFRIIDEEKFNALDDKAFLELRKKGYLPFIYAQMFSGLQWQRLSHMLGAQMKEAA
jgi:hypothetical protein